MKTRQNKSQNELFILDACSKCYELNLRKKVLENNSWTKTWIKHQLHPKALLPTWNNFVFVWIFVVFVFVFVFRFCFIFLFFFRNKWLIYFMILLPFRFLHLYEAKPWNSALGSIAICSNRLSEKTLYICTTKFICKNI
jgi:hypothetical protein